MIIIMRISTLLSFYKDLLFDSAKMYKRKEPEELKSELGVDSGDGRDTLE
jgi:hypothetical protein